MALAWVARDSSFSGLRTVIDTSPRLRRLHRLSIKTPPVDAANGRPLNRPNAAL